MNGQNATLRLGDKEIGQITSWGFSAEDTSKLLGGGESVEFDGIYNPPVVSEFAVSNITDSEGKELDADQIFTVGEAYPFPVIIEENITDDLGCAVLTQHESLKIMKYMGKGEDGKGVFREVT